MHDLTCHLTDTPLPAGKRVKESLENPTPLSFLKAVLVPPPGKPPSIVLSQFIVMSYLEDDLRSLHGFKTKLTHFQKKKK